MGQLGHLSQPQAKVVSAGLPGADQKRGLKMAYRAGQGQRVRELWQGSHGRAGRMSAAKLRPQITVEAY